MADQADATLKQEQPVGASEAIAAEAAAAVDPAPAKAETPRRKVGRPAGSTSAVRTARPPRGKKVVRAAAAPAKPVPARKKPASAKSIPASQRRRKGAETMTNETRGAAANGLFAADQFATMFGDVNERTRAAAERSARLVEELADITRGNVEAVVASSRVAAKAVETLGQDAAEISRRSFEEASGALRSLATAKSPTDFFKLQSDFARAAFDTAVAESARLSETVLKLAGEVAEPITSRYTVAADRVKSLAA